jgi:cation transporter-like permease
VAASVLGLFEPQLQKMVALAVLAPIVASQGGNAATQTMTIAGARARHARIGRGQRHAGHAARNGRWAC